MVGMYETVLLKDVPAYEMDGSISYKKMEELLEWYHS